MQIMHALLDRYLVAVGEEDEATATVGWEAAGGSAAQAQR
jgi:hypothetical protein